MHRKKAAALLASTVAALLLPRRGERTYQPASEHDSRGGVRDARRARAGRAGRRVRLQGRHAGPPRFRRVDSRMCPDAVTNDRHQAEQADPDSEGAVDEEVSQIVWTGNAPAGKVEQRTVHQVPPVIAIPPTIAGQSLEFRTVQTTETARWCTGSVPRPLNFRLPHQCHGERRRGRGSRRRRGGPHRRGDGRQPVEPPSRDDAIEQRGIEGAGHRGAHPGCARRADRARRDDARAARDTGVELAAGSRRAC